MEISLNLPERFTITAHTGCEDTPDNSLESIDKSFESGADIFEVDVWFDKSRVPILTHDDPAGGEPSLEDAFRRLVQYKSMRCNIDIKRTDNLREILCLAEKHGVFDRIFYTGINGDYVEAVRNSTPEIPYYLNMDVIPPEEQTAGYLLSLVEKVKSCGAIGINCRYDNATQKLVDIFHQNGLLVSLWTVDEESDMLKVLSLSPDNITTRKPGKLKNVIKSHINKS